MEDSSLTQFEQEHLAFQMKHELRDINTLSFSQRRYIGFRNRYEFEKKRILVANEHTYSVVGYDHRKHVFELLRQQVTDTTNQSIRFIDFLEDNQPSYLLMLVYDKITKKTSLMIMQFKKTEIVRDESQGIYEQIETDNRKIGNMIKEGVRQGKFTKSRKKSIDNFELVPLIETKSKRNRQS